VNARSGTFTLDEVLRTRYQPFYVVLLDSEPVETDQEYCCIGKNDNGQFQLIPMGENKIKDTASPTLLKQTVVVEPGGRFAYMPVKAGKKNDKNGIAVYRIDSKSGVLTVLPEHTVSLDFMPTDLVMDINGWNLYAVNPAVNKLGVYVVDPENGTLSLPNIPSPETGEGPVAIALDPAGRFSFVANAKDNTVSVFTHVRMKSPAMNPINSTGSSFVVGKNPVALAVDPTGKFLIVANKDSNNLSVFTIHFHEGRLESVKGSPFKAGNSPVSVATHPSGKFVYVLNEGSGDISSYRIDPLKGELSVLKYRVDAGKQPTVLTLDKGGRFAYVQNKGSAGFRKYAVDQTNGQLKFEGIVNMGPVVAIVK